MNEPTSTSFKDFIELYRRTEEANAPNSDSIWLQLEELARKALSTAPIYKKPHDVTPSDWAEAEQMFGYAAHMLVGKETTHVLGFLPLVVDVMSGALEGFRMAKNFMPLSKALAQRYAFPLKTYPCWIEHATLEQSNPKDIQTLLTALVQGQKLDEQWNRPDQLLCEEPCVRVFYLPVVFEVPNAVAQTTDYSLDDTYEEVSDGDDALATAFETVFTMDGDCDVRIQEFDMGAADDVVHAAQTQRDLREITSRLEMMKAAVSQRDNTQHEARVEIQLTWGAPQGAPLESYDTPVVRFIAWAKNADDVAPSHMVMGVHVDPRQPGQWAGVLADLLQACYRVGWPNVNVRQHSGTDAIQYWNEATASKTLQ